MLVEHFARQVSAQNGWKPVPFTPQAIEALKQYAWPGNIRELRNVVERLLLLAENEVDVEAVLLALPAASPHPTPTTGNAAVDTTGPLPSAFWPSSAKPCWLSSNGMIGTLPKPPRPWESNAAISTRNASS